MSLGGCRLGMCVKGRGQIVGIDALSTFVDSGVRLRFPDLCGKPFNYLAGHIFFSTPICVWVCLGRPEGNVGCLPKLSPPYFLRQISH